MAANTGGHQWQHSSVPHRRALVRLPLSMYEQVRGLCTFSENNNIALSALLAYPESRDIAFSFYNRFPLRRTIFNRFHPANLLTIYYHPLYDNIWIEGGRELVEYMAVPGLRPSEVKTSGVEISAFTTSTEL